MTTKNRRRRKAENVYDGIKAAATKRNLAASRQARDIGSIPPIKRPAVRRDACRDFLTCCEVYFPHRFTLAFSADHRQAAKKIETAVTVGGRFAWTMPRGRGKSTLAECAALWATMKGCRLFVMLLGSEKPHAERMLQNLKSELQYNDELADDFPEICFPIRSLEGEARRCSGQLHHGRPTSIIWTAEKIGFPVIPGSPSSGAVIQTAGLLGNIRGAVHITPDGRSLRPDLAIVDDPQTDQSANSPTQCETRERTIMGAVGGLSGPDKRLAMLIPCTIIRPNDLAARLIDKNEHPDLNGERFQRLKSFPDRMDLWEQYDLIRREDLANGLATTPNAREFYREHKPEMDKGAVVDWPESVEPGDLSALESTMRRFLADAYAFACEDQNDPPADSEIEKEFLSATEIAQCSGPTAKRVVPDSATKLVAAIDIQKDLLYYGVTAVAPNMSATIIDYGSWPGQSRTYYTLARAHPTISTEYPGRLEARLFGALTDLVELLTRQAWEREDGGLTYIDRVLIDASWSDSSDVLYNFVRQHRLASILTPCYGRYVGAASRELNDRKKKKGDIVGHKWRSPAVSKNQPTRYVAYDSNFYKTFVQNRLAQPDEDPGAWRLYRAKSQQHRMIADHLTAETPVPVATEDRRLVEWRLPVNKPDNHLLDVVVMSAVAASVEGCTLPEHQRQAKPKRKRSRKARLL